MIGLYDSYRQTYGTSLTNLTGASGATIDPDASSWRAWLAGHANQNEDDNGILLGTGTKAVDARDWSLDGRIHEGTDTGELVHGGVNFIEPAVVGSNVDFHMFRSFYNGSGASIEIQEMGLVLDINGPGDVLCARDLINFTITAGTTAVVEYVFRTTV
jgi:hypothetical protein